MKKQIKAAAAVLLTAVIATGLSGCSTKTYPFEPEVTSLYISRDGSLSGAEISDFGESYYDAAELKEFVEGAVTDYNAQEASLAFAYADDTDKELPVSIAECTVEDNKAKVILKYESFEDYIGVNRLENAEDVVKNIESMTIKEAGDANITLPDIFVDTKGDEASADKIMKKTKYYYVTVEGPAVIQLEGTVKYVSDNVRILDKNVVETAEEGISYIIYE